VRYSTAATAKEDQKRCEYPNFDELLAFFASLKGRSVVYRANLGSAGGAVNDLGFQVLASALDLQFTVTPHRYSPPNDSGVVLCGGGGKLVDYCDQASTFLSWAPAVRKLVVVLPQTVSGHRDLLKFLSPGVHVWARERVSYEYLRGTAPYPDNVFLAPDTAFALQSSPWLAPFAARRDLSKPADSPPPEKTLVSVRLDREVNPKRVNVPLPSCSEGVSSTCAWIKVMSNRQTWAAEKLTRRVALADRVVMGRLHVGIVAAMLGREVKLFKGSYTRWRPCTICRSELHTQCENLWQ